MKSYVADYYRTLDTAALLADIECRRWEMADLDAGADPWREHGIAFHVVLLEAAAEELKRRTRLRTNRHAPSWPARRPDHRPDAAAIKAAVNVEQFATGYLGAVLVRSGRDRLKGRCPLPDHPDDSPSFVIFADGGWRCFGCNRGGDLFTLAQIALGEPRFAVALAEVAGWARSVGLLSGEAA